MKWLTFGLLGVAAFAQEPRVSVRLFWRNPPRQVRIDPVLGVIERACVRCPAHEVDTARVISGSAKVWLDGTYRLAGDARPPIVWSGAAYVAGTSDGVQVTLTLPREQYVAAVLAGEASADAPAESLKAMAVAVRSYALHESEQGRHMGFDFCDSTHCQDMKLQNLNARFTAAVDATRNEILWFRGTPAATYYHQDCGGRTADAREVWPKITDAPYLSTHEDGYCLRANGVKWRSEIRKTDLASALAQFPAVHAKAPYSVAQRSASGRVSLLRVGSEKISATTFRFAINRVLGWDEVRSDAYDMRDAGDIIVLTGRGSGHGVGLCQNGAVEMAHEGKTYREILGYYYPGTKIGMSSQGIPWQRVDAEGATLWTTEPQSDGEVLRMAAAIGKQIEIATGLTDSSPIVLRAYPDVATFRNATGEPGWIAGFVRDGEIHLQPIAVLRRKRLLESTLRHELLHRAVEANAKPETARWFREGLVEYLASPSHSDGAVGLVNEAALLDRRNEAATRAAYAKAQQSVAGLVRRYGREEVLRWLRSGLPSNAVPH